MKDKSLKLIILSFIFIAILIIAPAKVNAAGLSMKDAVNTTLGKNYTLTWEDSDHMEYYHKINLTDRGILTMTFTRPVNNRGEFKDIELAIYDVNGFKMYDTYTFLVDDLKSNIYVYNIGLNKGTYYIGIYRSKGFNTKDALSTKYSFRLTKNSYCELEPNETKETATKMSVNKMYQGYFGGSLYSEYGDYYSIKLTKGQKYRIYIQNFDVLEMVRCFFDFRNPSGNPMYEEKEFTSSGYDKNGVKYYDFTASETGTYYIIVWNHYDGQQIDYKVGVYEDGNVISESKIGDVNNDEKIDTLDAVMILQSVAKKITLTNNQKAVADVNHDGKIDTLDAVKILQFVAKKISSL